MIAFNITNICINSGYWLLHFKLLTLIIISKLNKSSYDSSKLFYLIVLLNMLGKLIENVIGKRLWFHTIINNFVHPHQFMLQLKDLRIGQWKEPCIYWVNTRELNRELYTETSTLYTKTSMVYAPTSLVYTKDHVFSSRSTCVIHVV